MSYWIYLHAPNRIFLSPIFVTHFAGHNLTGCLAPLPDAPSPAALAGSGSGLRQAHCVALAGTHRSINGKIVPTTALLIRWEKFSQMAKFTHKDEW
ncbi:TPA: hypothetical protein SIA35_001997 [Aeromonas sobria]|nr:hypothetical protein [Aeromonas sobria]